MHSRRLNGLVGRSPLLETMTNIVPTNCGWDREGSVSLEKKYIRDGKHGIVGSLGCLDFESAASASSAIPAILGFSEELS